MAKTTVSQSMTLVSSDPGPTSLAGWHELVVPNLEAFDAVVAVDDDALRAPQKGDPKLRRTLGLERFVRVFGQILEGFVGVLVDPVEFRGNPVDFGANLFDIHRAADDLELAGRTRTFVGAATIHDRGGIDLLFAAQPVDDIERDVSESNDADVVADGEFLLAEWRQFVEVVDEILGVKHAFGIFALQAQPARALCSDRHDDGVEAQRPDLVHRDIGVLADLDVPEVVDVRLVQDAPKDRAQPALHAVFVRVNSKLREPAGFDIPVEHHDVVAFRGELVGPVDRCGAGPEHRDRVGLFTHPYS
jgi:hypothetical protein